VLRRHLKNDGPALPNVENHPEQKNMRAPPAIDYHGLGTLVPQMSGTGNRRDDKDYDAFTDCISRKVAHPDMFPNHEND